MVKYIERCPYCNENCKEFFPNQETPTILYCHNHGLIPIVDEVGFEHAKRLFWRGFGKGRFRKKAREFLKTIGYNRKGKRGYDDHQIDRLFKYWEKELNIYVEKINPKTFVPGIKEIEYKKPTSDTLPAISPKLLNHIILEARELFFQDKRGESAKLLLRNGLTSQDIENGNDGFFDVWYKEMGNSSRTFVPGVKQIDYKKPTSDTLPAIPPKLLEYHESGYLYVRAWADKEGGNEISASFWCSRLTRDRLVTPIMDLECRPGKYNYYAVYSGERKDGSFEIKPGEKTEIDIVFDIEYKPTPTPSPTPEPVPVITEDRIWCPNCAKSVLKLVQEIKNKKGQAIKFVFWCKNEGKFVSLTPYEYKLYKEGQDKYFHSMEKSTNMALKKYFSKRIKNPDGTIARDADGKALLETKNLKDLSVTERKRLERFLVKDRKKTKEKFLNSSAEKAELGDAMIDRRQEWSREKHITRSKKILGGIEGKAGNRIMKVFPLFALVVLGFIASYTLGSFWFWLAFATLGVFFVIPSASEFKPPKNVNININSGDRYIFKKIFNDKHLGWGFTRSILKIGALTCFALGFMASTFPFANIGLIITAFVGYFSLKLTYDPEVGSEYVESVLRFGVLGFLLIPWIFFSIFESMLLGLIAVAFFAIPPKPSKETGETEEIRGIGQLIDKGLFFIIMIIVLVISGALGGVFGWSAIAPTAGWELQGTLASVFLYFWIISSVAGFFSPAQARPTTGFIMLGAAVILFALGPGTNEVGTAFLGPWWPTVYTGFESTVQPITTMFTQLSASIGTGLYMISNPVGYAQGMVNGSYTTDPTTGLAGAFGVEIEEFKTTPIFVAQPYSAIVRIKNKGAFEARDVCVALSFNMSYRNIYGTRGGVSIPGLSQNDLTIDDLGFKDTTICIEGDGGDLAKLDTRQLFFESTGISCETAEKAGLREKFLPLNTIIDYGYSINSSLEIEFMSRDEWDRRVSQGSLITFSKKQSKLSNSPAMLRIDTLEQPIREGTRYHIQFDLLPDQTQKNAKIKSAKITLKVPEKMGTPYQCNFLPKGVDTNDEKSYAIDAVDGVRTYRWDNLKDQYLIFCLFSQREDMTSSAETFLIQADASYIFERSEVSSTKVEFGGILCDSYGPTTPLCNDVVDQFTCDSFVTEECLCPNNCINSGQKTSGNCGGEDITATVNEPDEVMFGDYAPYITSASNAYSVNQDILKAIITQESNWQKGETSGASAKGMMQLRSITIQDITEEGRPSHDYCRDLGHEITSADISFDSSTIFDPEKNIKAGSCYFSYLDNRGPYADTESVLAAWNMGPQAFTTALVTCQASSWSSVKDCSSIPSETRTFVSKVMDYYDFYRGMRSVNNIWTPEMFRNDLLAHSTGLNTIVITDGYDAARSGTLQETHKGYDFATSPPAQIGDKEIPALYSGRVVDIKSWDDYGGKAVWVESNLFGKRFVTSYGHINVHPFIKVGSYVGTGTIMGSVRGTTTQSGSPTAHLDVKMFNWPLEGSNKWYDQAFDWQVAV
ncbi:MAG: transglycosylase SLT domain-containing protein [Candidatus Aenigmatarchaeota archaeon]